VSKEKYFEGVGRRKVSTARVRIYEGDKTSTVNDMAVVDYFKGLKSAEKDINRPFVVTGLEKKYYFTAKVNGGGITGQVDSVKLGITRALYEMNPELKSMLRGEGLVTRDPRAVERKKYNLRKARKKGQFSKR
jgi:small subunit ribosomal protein S9